MNRQTNTLIFYDNEDLDEKIRQMGKRLFMQPYKAEGRANKTFLTDAAGNQQECIVNEEEQYVFNNYTYDFGRILKIDDACYRILWSKQPERREVLNTLTGKISKQPAGRDTLQTSPVISIVMPVYNANPDYLRESIESIINQTFRDFELLIIDDGSTETQGIDCIQACRDSRIRLIHNPHDFVDSLNKGIAESKGKYIARMDADDIMLPHRLQTQYEFMETHPEIDVCGSWMETVGLHNEIVKLQGAHDDIAKSLLLGNSMAHPTVLLRKSSVCRDGTNLYPKGYDCAEDYKLWTDLAVKGLRFANIQEVLLKYRISDQQVTKIRQKEMQQSAYRIQMEYAEQLMQKMTNEEERFFELFELLIRLHNEGVIKGKQMLSVIYQLYSREQQ